DDPQHFARPDRTPGDLEAERIVLFGHRGYDEEVLAVGTFLVRPLLEDHLGVPEPDVLFGKVALEVLVDAHPDPLGAGDDAEYGRFAVTDVDGVREHVEDGEVVLDNDDRAGRRKLADELRGRDPLVNVQEWRDLVEEVEV